jgi:hypothetical protein
MTKAVGDDKSMFNSLQEVVHLFELAQTSVFKLMSHGDPGAKKALYNPYAAAKVPRTESTSLNVPVFSSFRIPLCVCFSVNFFSTRYVKRTCLSTLMSLYSPLPYVVATSPVFSRAIHPHTRCPRSVMP